MKEMFRNWIEFFEESLSTKLARLILKIFGIVLFAYFIWPYAQSTYYLIRDRGNIEIQMLSIEKRMDALENKMDNLKLPDELPEKKE